jgi:hypothetical protein
MASPQRRNNGVCEVLTSIGGLVSFQDVPTSVGMRFLMFFLFWVDLAPARDVPRVLELFVPGPLHGRLVLDVFL